MKSAFSDILSSLRREKSFSQRRVAADLGISQALLSHYENGAREPKLEFVIKACNYYDVSADYILGRTDMRNGKSELLMMSVSGIATELEDLVLAEEGLVARLKQLAEK